MNFKKVSKMIFYSHLGMIVSFLFVLLVAFVAIANLVVQGESAKYIYKHWEHVPKAQAVLIPGAAIYSDGRLSEVFKKRVDKAIELYNHKKVSKFLVSGDNSTISHNEVNPVRNYLLEKNIPSGDIFLDHAGFDTYSSMYRARDIFQVESLIIVTQSFHLPRAVFIANTLHIKAFGVPADETEKNLKNYVREIFANEKAFFDLARHRKPKYLGDVIPITGDGQNYE